jgi:hypothetical protein
MRFFCCWSVGRFCYLRRSKLIFYHNLGCPSVFCQQVGPQKAQTVETKCNPAPGRLETGAKPAFILDRPHAGLEP